MKQFFKWFFIVILVLLVAVAAFKDIVLQLAVEKLASATLGAPVKIGRMHLGLFHSQISIYDAAVYNPVGFKAGYLLFVKHAAVSYDFASLMKQKFQFPELVLDVTEISAVTNADGKLNVNELKVAHPAPDKAKAPAPAFHIGKLSLKVGRVVTAAVLQNRSEASNTLELNLDRTYTDINDAQKLAYLVIFDTLKEAGVKNIKAQAEKSLLKAINRGLNEALR